MNVPALILIPFVVYILLMLGTGWYFYFRTRTISDYILGGRRLNSWVASLSAQASDMSGWLLLGLPGYAYLAGLESLWIAGGLTLGTYLNWKFVAPRLREATQTLGDSITLPDFFENRFQPGTPLLRIFSALFILIFFVIYTASGFVAGAKLFSTIFHLPYLSALAAGMGVVILYTLLGGFLAVCWTDFIQGTLMFSAIIIVPLLLIDHAGGANAAFQQVSRINPHLLSAFSDSKGHSISVLAIVSLTAWGLGYFGQPHILARFMAINEVKAVRKARKIAMIWVIVCLAGAVLAGVLSHSYLTVSLSDSEAETVFLRLIQSPLIPPLAAGVLLSAVLAAIMSTADSQLLVASSALTEDLYRLLWRKKASQRELVMVSRAAVVLISGIAFIIGLNPESSVLELVAYAWAGFGAAFGPVILFALFWPAMTAKGAMAGMVTGGLTVLIWRQLHGGLFELYEIVPGVLFAAASIVFFSLINQDSRSF